VKPRRVILAAAALLALAPRTAAACDAGPSNLRARAFLDLDHSAADYGVFCEDPSGMNRVLTWSKQDVVTPSLDGQALEIAITGGSSGNVNALFYRTLTAEPAAMVFALRLSFRFTPTTHNNEGSPSAIQALEFTINKYIGGARYEWALQWRNVGNGGDPGWRYWHPHQADRWVDLGIADRLAADTWHSLELHGEIVQGQVHYTAFEINGAWHVLDKTVAPAVDTFKDDRLAVGVQLDGNSTETPYTVHLDEISIVAAPAAPMTSSWDSSAGTLQIFRDGQKVAAYQRDTGSGRSIANAITEMYAVGNSSDNLLMDSSPLVPPQILIGVGKGQCTNEPASDACDYFVHHNPTVTVLQASGSAVRFRVTATASQHDELGTELPQFSSDMTITVPYDAEHTVITYSVRTILNQTLDVKHALRPLPFFEVVANAYQTVSYLQSNCQAESVSIPTTGAFGSFLGPAAVCADRPWAAVHANSKGNVGMILEAWQWSSGSPQLVAYTEPSVRPGAPNLYFQSSDASRTYASGDWQGNITFVAYTTAANASPVAQIRAYVPGPFTDDPVVAGATTVRAVHISELRGRINAARATLGLSLTVWQVDPIVSAGTVIRAAHVNELRSSLAEVYATAGRPALTFTDSVLNSTIAVKASHVNELRVALRLVE
jgi:hypothetical protein